MARRSKKDRINEEHVKATKAEIERRVNAVYKLLINYASRGDICQYASTTWGVDVRTADRYIATATDRLKELTATERAEELGKAKALRYALIKEARQAGDRMQAHIFLTGFEKLYGLQAPSKVEHSGTLTLEQAAQLTDEELDAKLKERGYV